MLDTSSIHLSSISGIKLSVHPFGARITSLIIPLESGPVSVTEEEDSILDFKNLNQYSGATIGPVANRIHLGQFKINNEAFQLELNQKNFTLHSGNAGFHLATWDILEQSENSVTFGLTRNDLEDGFPGNRKFEICYTLNEDDLKLDFSGMTDRPTFINMCNHVYFNLGMDKTLEHHLFMIESNGALVLNDSGIPTGKIIPPLQSFDLNDFQRLDGRKFDHNFILKNNFEMQMVAAAYCPSTDITLEVFTDQPGLQFYTGHKHFFAFETQHFPDSPNHPKFPSTLIDSNSPYHQQCIYSFNY